MTARIITATNVNYALEEGLNWLKVAGLLTGSRNGPVLKAPGPVITAYKRPDQRVLFSTLRDCNPFFHLFESMWMLAGRNDTASLKPLVPRMQEFSDDQHTLNGAYGFRWREYFGFDQIKKVIEMLRKDRGSRRIVLTMWDAMGADNSANDGYHYSPDLLNQTSKDLPCNTHIYFDASAGDLDMTVCCRSNDVVWGAYGANAVHMSFLHELIAAASGLNLGTYYQMSNNYHIYVERPDTARLLDTDGERHQWSVLYTANDEYAKGNGAIVRPLLAGNEADSLSAFLQEMENWVELGGYMKGAHFSFTQNVLNPMMNAHRLHKEGATHTAIGVLQAALPSDWRTAGLMWLSKRMLAANNKTV
jgi:thymidylate synthase